MDISDLVFPGLVLILIIALIGAVMQAVKGRRWIQPAYICTVSIIGATALAVAGGDDLVSRQFSYVLVVLAGLLGLFITGIGSIIAIRRSTD